jgi:hypothetical protein
MGLRVATYPQGLTGRKSKKVSEYLLFMDVAFIQQKIHKLMI